MPLSLLHFSKYDLEFNDFSDYHNRLWAEILLYFVFVASILLCNSTIDFSRSQFASLAVLTVVRYSFKLEYLKKRGAMAEHETLFSTKMIWWLLLEICIIMIIPYPWLLGKKRSVISYLEEQ